MDGVRIEGVYPAKKPDAKYLAWVDFSCPAPAGLTRVSRRYLSEKKGGYASAPVVELVCLGEGAAVLSIKGAVLMPGSEGQCPWLACDVGVSSAVRDFVAGRAVEMLEARRRGSAPAAAPELKPGAVSASGNGHAVGRPAGARV